MNNTTLTISFAVSSVLLVACAGGPGDSTTDQPQSSVQQSAVERCSGELRCWLGGEQVVETRLQRRGQACFAGEMRLDPNGRAIGGSVDATWYPTGSGFDLCVDGGCLQCISSDTPSCETCTDGECQPCGSTAAAGTSAAGRCEGVASSCDGRGAGECALQDGCTFRQHTRLTWDNQITFEYECEGYATSCSELHDADSCRRQVGCSWR